MIDERAEKNASNQARRLLRDVALTRGNFEVVSSLLHRGADVNAMDNDGLTPLALSVREGHFEVVRVLADREANVEAKINDGWTPLAFADDKCHSEIVRFLIDKDADKNALDAKSQIG